MALAPPPRAWVLRKTRFKRKIQKGASGFQKWRGAQDKDCYHAKNYFNALDRGSQRIQTRLGPTGFFVLSGTAGALLRPCGSYEHQHAAHVPADRAVGDRHPAVAQSAGREYSSSAAPQTGPPPPVRMLPPSDAAK